MARLTPRAAMFAGALVVYIAIKVYRASDSMFYIDQTIVRETLHKIHETPYDIDDYGKNEEILTDGDVDPRKFWENNKGNGDGKHSGDDMNETYGADDVRLWDDNRIPNFYNDRFETYDCRRKYSVPGSHPKFMVLGVHKGGSTALYNYLAKHGRIRPAVCKEIHFFDVDEEFARGKSYYLRNFPDVSFWRSRVITGEGSPDYIRMPAVPARVKNMFPDTKFILTLREPGTRFQSHWVGKKDQHILPMATMTCEEAWNTSVAAYEQCTSTDTMENCEKKLHENAAVRGVYLPQIEHWLKFFPPSQFLIVQAEAMFENTTKIVQSAAKFLNIRAYNEQELDSLHSAKTGSAHHDEPLARDCDHLKARMDAFYAGPNRRLKQFLKQHFPHVMEEWIEGWSGM